MLVISYGCKFKKNWWTGNYTKDNERKRSRWEIEKPRDVIELIINNRDKDDT